MPISDLILHFHKCFNQVITSPFKSDSSEKTEYQKYFRSYFKGKTSSTERQPMVSDFIIIKEISLKKVIHFLLTSSISFSFGDPEQRQTR